MSSLAQIRTALKATISAAVSGIQGYDRVPPAVNVPAFIVKPSATDFQVAMGRGVDKQSLDVIVLVGRADDELAQDKLDPFVNGSGASSIRQAVFNTRSLGLTDTDAQVTGMADYGAEYTIDGIDYVGARLTVEVLTSGTA